MRDAFTQGTPSRTGRTRRGSARGRAGPGVEPGQTGRDRHVENDIVDGLGARSIPQGDRIANVLVRRRTEPVGAYRDIEIGLVEWGRCADQTRWPRFRSAAARVCRWRDGQFRQPSRFTIEGHLVAEHAGGRPVRDRLRDRPAAARPRAAQAAAGTGPRHRRDARGHRHHNIGGGHRRTAILDRETLADPTRRRKRIATTCSVDPRYRPDLDARRAARHATGGRRRAATAADRGRDGSCNDGGWCVRTYRAFDIEARRRSGNVAEQLLDCAIAAGHGTGSCRRAAGPVHVAQALRYRRAQEQAGRAAASIRRIEHERVAHALSGSGRLLGRFRCDANCRSGRQRDPHAARHGLFVSAAGPGREHDARGKIDESTCIRGQAGVEVIFEHASVH